MTSNVKSGQQIFLGLHNFSDPRCIGKVGASKRRRLILLLSVGWVPPYLHPSGACLSLGTSILIQASERRRGLHRTGAASFPMHVGNLPRSGLISTLRCQRNLLGNGPHETCQFTGNGHSDNVIVFPS